MKYYHIKFEDVTTGEIAYREYPVIAQWSTRSMLAEWLNKRTFLINSIPVKVVEV